MGERTDMDDLRARVDDYDFRDVHPAVRFGTASDRYAAWVGQIYPQFYAERISSRKRKLGGKTYEERTVPVESVRDYFEHFEALELDFTFYRTLVGEDGEPTNNFFVLQKYAEHAPDSASFFVKAPRQYFARKLRRRGSYVDNPDFLGAEAYLRQFHEPALKILGDRLSGVIFQQEYQRVADSPSPEGNVAELDAFFGRLPAGVQAHLELRSGHLLEPPYFNWLEGRGLGHVFSHWTWLPKIREQWKRVGGRFTAADGNVVARLLTPRGMKYAEAYARAHPFDKPAEELAGTNQARDMVLDAVALIYRAEAKSALLNLLVNNRAWGNAPDLARTIAHRALDERDGARATRS